MPTNDERRLIAKILGLMGSSFDGEIAAAGRAAEAARKSINCTWFDLVAANDDTDRLRREIARIIAVSERYRVDRDDYARQLHAARAELESLRPPTTGAAAWLEANRARLSTWERDFMASLIDQRARGKDLSDKQMEVANRIGAKFNTRWSFTPQYH